MWVGMAASVGSVVTPMVSAWAALHRHHHNARREIEARHQSMQRALEEAIWKEESRHRDYRGEHAPSDTTSPSRSRPQSAEAREFAVNFALMSPEDQRWLLKQWPADAIWRPDWLPEPAPQESLPQIGWNFQTSLDRATEAEDEAEARRLYVAQMLVGRSSVQPDEFEDINRMFDRSWAKNGKAPYIHQSVNLRKDSSCTCRKCASLIPPGSSKRYARAEVVEATGAVSVKSPSRELSSSASEPFCSSCSDAGSEDRDRESAS